jgi:hypothetical protein
MEFCITDNVQRTFYLKLDAKNCLITDQTQIKTLNKILNKFKVHGIWNSRVGLEYFSEIININFDKYKYKLFLAAIPPIEFHSDFGVVSNVSLFQTNLLTGKMREILVFERKLFNSKNIDGDGDRDRRSYQDLDQDEEDKAKLNINPNFNFLYTNHNNNKSN